MPEAEKMFRMYVGAMSADGGFQARYAVRKSRLHGPFRKLIMATRIPAWMRSTVAGLLNLLGQKYQATLVRAGRKLSASHYWLLIHAMNRYRRKFAKQFEQQGLDVLLSPAFALPAMCHDDGIDLLPAGSPVSYTHLTLSTTPYV